MLVMVGQPYEYSKKALIKHFKGVDFMDVNSMDVNSKKVVI